MTNVDEMTGTRNKMNDINEMTNDGRTVYVDICGFILHPTIVKRRPTGELIKLVQDSIPIPMDGNSLISIDEPEITINVVKKEDWKW